MQFSDDVIKIQILRDNKKVFSMVSPVKDRDRILLIMRASAEKGVQWPNLSKKVGLDDGEAWW